MSDITVPSWRARPENSGPNWRMLPVAGGLLGVVALGGAVYWGASRMGGPSSVPLIEPDARPVKIRPETPGGLVVPNQDQLVLEPPAVRRAAERNAGANARLDQGPELPALERLRQQAAPPAPVAAIPPPLPSALATAPLPVPVAPRPEQQAATLPPVAQPPVVQQVVAQPVVVQPGVPAPARPAAVATGRAMVQLGALSSEESARGEWERLQRRVPELAAMEAVISRFDREGQAPLFRLRAGGLPNAAAARSLCEAVRAKAAPCMTIGG